MCLCAGPWSALLPTNARWTPSTVLQMGRDLVTRPGFCDSPTSVPLTTCLSFRESKSPFIAYLPRRAEDLSKCCVNARLPYDNYRIKN